MPLDLLRDTKEVHVHIYSEASAAATGRIAVARIFFEDGSHLSMVYQNFEGKGMLWRPPFLQLQQNGHVEHFPTLGGTLLEQAGTVVERALARLKEKFQKPAYGTTYKVTREGAELIPNPEAGPIAV